MTPDIIVSGTNGADGAPGPKPAPASSDYTHGPPAAGGSCGVLWICECASNGLAAGSGNGGNTGGGGQAGGNAPTLCIIVGRLVSDLAVQTQGGKGGKGGPGSNGSDGGQGQEAGTNAPFCLQKHSVFKAQCTPAVGGVGGDAGHGGDGGPGGGGGDGGYIYIYYSEAQSVSPGGTAYQIFPLSNPGDIGKGGAPGLRGNPGLGGLNEAVDNNPQTRQRGGFPNGDGGWGPNGSPPGVPRTVLMLPTS
jgi:hypothetical protein